MGYLVVSRKVGERLKIGEVEILVSDVSDKKVDLAVKAPREIFIEKLGTHIDEEKKQAEKKANK